MECGCSCSLTVQKQTHTQIGRSLVLLFFLVTIKQKNEPRNMMYIHIGDDDVGRCVEAATHP
jgi:hypothetical protein